ncbi:MAG: ATP-binding protein, partial [Propionibacterium sp.]|nr:ATP-binding protein [Propionibacterium sp.]
MSGSRRGASPGASTSPGIRRHVRIFPWEDGTYSVLVQRVFVIVHMLGMTTSVVGNFPAALIEFRNAPRQLVVLVLLPLLGLPLISGAASLGALLSNRLHRGDPVEGRSARRASTLDRVWRWASLLTLVLYVVALGAESLLAAPTPLATQAATPNIPLLVGFGISLVTMVPLLLPPALGFSYVLALVPLQVWVGASAHGALTSRAFEAPLHQLAYDLVYVLAVTWLIGQAQWLDRSRAARRAQEHAVAEEGARTTGRQLLDDYVHDHVLSALVPLAGDVQDRLMLGDIARTALDSLEHREAGRDLDDVHALFTEVERRARANAVPVGVSWQSGGVPSRGQPSPQESTDLPHDVAQALLDATGEALTNSLRHADRPGDPPVSRGVDMSCTGREVTIRVWDDGCGFDPGNVTPGRHGISSSILGRMQAVGGRADIVTRPTAGTS